MNVPVAERLFTRVEYTDNCWLWLGGKVPDGYGSIKAGKSRSVHRVAYEICVGPIPEGLTLDHLCRVRHCVNPDHLEPVTRGVNTLRGQGPSAKNAVKTHCPQGHEFNEENTKWYQGRRYCRPCHKVHSLAWWHRQKVTTA